MKYDPRMMIVFAVSFSLATAAFSQGTFQNLGFEAAHNLPAPRAMMSPADALPGWNCFVGTNQAGWAWYNNISLDSAAAGIQSSTSSYPPAGLRGGEYCLSLQPGYVFTSPYDYYFGRASIAQTGQLPSDAQSIRFKATYPFSITFAGNAVPLVVTSPRTGYNVYGGDISQFAGQTGELRITSSPPSGFALRDVNYLDSITFSITPIPEPSTIGLVVIGFGLLLTARVVLRTAHPR